MELLVASLAALFVGLGVAAFYLTRGASKVLLARRLGVVERAVVDLEVLHRDLLDSHKRLRSREAMQARRSGAHSATSTPSPEDAPPPGLTLKDQLRLRAGLIPRPRASNPAPADGG